MNTKKKVAAIAAAIYRSGFVEDELRRLASAPQREMLGGDYRQAIGMLAAAMLIILDRLPADGGGVKP